LKTEIEEGIQAIESLLEELNPVLPPKEPTPPSEENQKWSKENHPAFQAGYRKPGAPEEQGPVTYKVNDVVLARWLSGDKAYYPAKITSITGSSADPVYYVTFKSYGTTEALRRPDLKPMNNAESRKRKAESSPVPAIAPVAPSSNVISAAADINPELASAVKQEVIKPIDEAPKPAKGPKKIKAKKELEAGKSKWQDFTNKSKVGKATKKESMFRTGSSVTARGKI
jgi:survival-of-motor-neuron-related-splicing factor 30